MNVYAIHTLQHKWITYWFRNHETNVCLHWTTCSLQLYIMTTLKPNVNSLICIDLHILCIFEITAASKRHPALCLQLV